MWDEVKRKLLSAALAGKDWLHEGVSVGTRLRSLDYATTPIPRKKPSLLPTPDEILGNEGAQTAAGFLGPIKAVKMAQMLMRPRFSTERGSLSGITDSMDLDRYGFAKPLSASRFLELASPTNYDKDTLKFIAEQIAEGRPLGHPHLSSTWNPVRNTWDVIGHEGRHRAKTIADMFGPETELPVHIFPREISIKNVSNDMRQAPFTPQAIVSEERLAAANMRRAERERWLRGEDE